MRSTDVLALELDVVNFKQVDRLRKLVARVAQDLAYDDDLILLWYNTQRADRLDLKRAMSMRGCDTRAGY